MLGAAAGGGFPQWNSNAAGCRRARSLDPTARARTQASLAVSGNGTDWFLINASPDLRQQLAAAPDLHPRAGLRSSPIGGVFLTSSEVDAVAGLLSLREGQPFLLFATAETHAVLAANPMFDVLARDLVSRRVLGLDETVDLPGGLSVELFAVPGKVPLYLEGVAADADGDTVGALVAKDGATLAYVPACAAMTRGVADRLRGADAVLFDGTLWSDDEMIAAGIGSKTGRRMGHMSISGPDGAIAMLAPIEIGRRIFVHINNSNPVLLDETREHAIASEEGWEIADDGMEIRL